jgi:hypothetical protein
MVLILCLNFTQDDEQDALIRNFTDLKDILNQIADLCELDPNHFLGMLAVHYIFKTTCYYEAYCLLVYDAMKFDFCVSTFHRNLLLARSGYVTS